MEDSESYVYLAALQGMADIADLDVGFSFGVLARIVGRGGVEIEGEVISFAVPTRVKAAEAMGMIARRRKEGGIELKIVLDGVGVVEEVFKGGVGDGVEESKAIDRGTRGWFEKGKKNEEDDDNEGGDWEEMKIRLRTSGPIYGVEEGSMPKGEGGAKWWEERSDDLYLLVKLPAYPSACDERSESQKGLG